MALNMKFAFSHKQALNAILGLPIVFIQDCKDSLGELDTTKIVLLEEFLGTELSNIMGMLMNSPNTVPQL